MKTNSLLFGVLSFLLFFISTSYAATPLVQLVDKKEIYILKDSISVFKDQKNRNFQEIYKPNIQSKFKVLGKDSFGFPNTTYWVHLRLKNQSSEQKKWFLEINYPFLDKVTAYYVENGTLIDTKIMGDHFPFSQRVIKHRNLIFPIKLKTNVEKSIFFKITTDGFLAIPLKLYSPQAFIEKNNTEQLLLGLYYGVALIVIFYSFLFYIKLKDKNYLYYLIFISTYTLCQLTSNGLAYKYLWPNLSWWNNRALLILGCCFLISISFFTQLFLQTKEFSPKIHSIFKVLITISTGFLILGFFLKYQTLIFPMVLLGLASFITIFIASILSLSQKNLYFKYFFVAWSGFLVGGIIYLLRYASILPHNTFTTYSIQFGSVIQMLLLSLALGERIHQVQQEKHEAQIEAIKNHEESLKNLEEANRYKDELIDNWDRLNKLKDEFLANTSHELRSPLNGIIGIAESLIEGSSGNLFHNTIENLKMIVFSGRRLANLVNDLLDFSKLKHHTIGLHVTNISIRELTDVVLMLSKPLAKESGIQLYNLMPRNLPLIRVDENRILQVLHNLIGNAIKFTENGKIEVCAIIKDDFLEVSVVDTGLGIPKEKQALIFQSFEQLDGSSTRKFQGTGIGLTISKQLVELHGGTIWVESEVNQGSKFIFSVPLSANNSNLNSSQIAKVLDFKKSETPMHVIAPKYEAKSHTQEGKSFTILAVDDEAINLQVITNHLAVHGYTIIQSKDGIEALEEIEKNGKPDLLLLDIMMPKMMGFDVCKEIRKKYSLTELPIILITAKNQIADLITGFASGANDFLTKPFLKGELVSRVKNHLMLVQETKEKHAQAKEVAKLNEELESKVKDRTQQYQKINHDLSVTLTILKETQNDLIQSEKMASLGALVAGVAHEMNTPIGTVLTAASHLTKEVKSIYKSVVIDKKVKKSQLVQFMDLTQSLATSIESNLERTRDLINNFKQVSVHQSIEELQYFNVHSYLDTVIVGLKPELQKSYVNLLIAGNPGLEITSYPGSLSRIVTSLITNSLIHGFDERKGGNIRINFFEYKSSIIFQFIDNGKGMSSEIQEQIFEPFFTTKRGKGGTGLGLHIIYNLVTQRFKGKIFCESKEKEGTTFQVSIPKKMSLPENNLESA